MQTTTSPTRRALRALVASATLAALAACSEAPTTALQAAGPARHLDAVRQDFADGDHHFSFAAVDVPGAQGTAASGINGRGDIVGTYADAAGRQHGFLLTHGADAPHADAFTTIDYPGAVLTNARGISPHGEIVGTYRMAGEPAINLHGFRRTSAGDFVAADYPGHTSTIAQRILPDGTVLGCRHDDDFMESMRGVVIGHGSSHETDLFASMHNGATPDLRRIAGLRTDMLTGRQEGYLIDDGALTPLVVPGSTATSAWDVSPSGHVVGIYRDATGERGFLLTNHGYVRVDFPGATATRAFGINTGGAIVGQIIEGGRSHGFIAAVAP